MIATSALIVADATVPDADTMARLYHPDGRVAYVPIKDAEIWRNFGLRATWPPQEGIAEAHASFVALQAPDGQRAVMVYDSDEARAAYAAGWREVYDPPPPPAQTRLHTVTLAITLTMDVPEGEDAAAWARFIVGAGKFNASDPALDVDDDFDYDSHIDDEDIERSVRTMDVTVTSVSRPLSDVADATQETDADERTHDES